MAESGGPSSLRGLPMRPPQVQKSVDEKLRDASKMYEKLFMREMVKAMRTTVSESGLIKQNQAERIFREELDSEHVNNWSARGGVGFADLIYENMIERFGVQLGLKKAIEKPQGPLPMNEKSDYTGMQRVATSAKDSVAYKFDVDSPNGPLIAPWSGILTGKRELEKGSYLLEIKHDNGLTGRLVFRGTPERLELGRAVQGGETLGVLSPEARSVFWSVAGDSARDAEKTTPTVSE